MQYKEYDNETLARLQRIELDILKDFDEFCEKHGIDYFGMGGTAIGAKRHKGFIPWDDDIDIGMTRRNYDRFCELKDELPDKYTLLTCDSPGDYPLMNAHLILKGTRFKEEAFKELEFENGIFLDIFCFENVSDNDIKMKWQVCNAWFWGKILILRYTPEPVLYFHGVKEKIIRFGCRFISGMLRMLNVSKKGLLKRIKRHSERYNNTKTERVAFMFEPSPFLSVLRLDDIEPTKKYEFEGLSIRFPNRIEVLLSKRYGDYMTLPPVEKRHNHLPYLLEFPKEDNE